MSDQGGTTGGSFWEGGDGEQTLQRCKTLLNTVSDGIYQLDADGRFVAVDDGVIELTGCTRDDLLGKHVSVLIGESDLDRIEDVIRDRPETGADDTTYEIVIETADGDRIPCELHIERLEDGNEFEGTIGLVRDITEHKARENELERYETTVETVWDGVTTLDADDRFVMVNEAFCEMTGYDRVDILGEHATLILNESDYGEAGELHDRVAEGELDAATLEYDLQTADGESIPVEARFGPCEFEDGTVGGTGVIRDVTEHREREQELERFEVLFTESRDVNVVLGPDGTYRYVTPSMENVLGHDPEDLVGENAFDYVHPDDHEPVFEEFAAMVENPEREPVVEYRFRRADGSWAVIESRGRNLLGEPNVEGIVVYSRDITERKEHERAVEESEARFRMLAENLEEMVWISHPDTREILYLNPAYEDIWGRNREALVDDATTFLGTVHSDDRQRVEQAYADVPDERFDEEYRIVRPDGDVRWLKARADLVRSEGKQRVIGIAEDITERKARERALEESEERYRTLAENFPNGAVGLFDEDLEYTAVGGQLLNATGVDPEDRIGSSVHDIYPDEIVAEVEQYFHAALEGEVNAFEAEYHDRHLFAHTLPVRDTNDEVYAGMLVVQNVTERREYERKLEESNERLEQFAYAASHDLREPLRMVSSYLQLLESRYTDDLDEDAKEFIEFAVDGADRMREMIEGLLEYSRVETQGDPFELVELESILDEALKNLQLKIEESNAEILTEPLPRVEGDAGQLRQVFQNLLDNAIEYSGDEPPRVDIAIEQYGDEHVISVRDRGIGIESEQSDRVFEVFQRLHTRDEHDGTGIGLALCERIIERHGGKIWVESELGEGTSFYFSLPAVGEDQT